MSAYPQPFPAQAQLYLLTIQQFGQTSNVYCMAMSPEDAFTRYLDRLTRRRESIVGIELVHAETADPHVHSHRQITATNLSER